MAGLAAELQPRVLLLESRDMPDHEALAAAVRQVSPRTRVMTCEDVAAAPGRPPAGAGGSPPPEGSSPLDPAVILSTTGTTGAPKHVVRLHGELALRWWASAARSGATPGEARLVQLPLSHGFGFGMAMGGLLTGGRLVLMERFSPAEAVRLVESERIGVLFGAPAHFDLILARLEEPRAAPADVSSLRYGCGSGAIFPAPLVRRILDALPLRFTLAYGCSEGLGWGTGDPEDLRRGSVGRPPAEHVRVVDPVSRKPLAAGEVGEIALRRLLPVRYWGGGASTPSMASAPSAGEEAWYHSGDLGRVDEDGRLYVVGRLGTHICRGGVWVQPEEVEAALAGHPLLRDVAVLGVPDDLLGERVCACVVPRDSGISLEDLTAWLASRLAAHRHPEVLCPMSEIPRGSTGKVDRRQLRERVGALSAQGRGRAAANDDQGAEPDHR